MADTMKITVLPDGNLKIETDKVSAVNHGNAEMLVRELIKANGGTATRTRKTGVPQETHNHAKQGN